MSRIALHVSFATGKPRLLSVPKKATHWLVFKLLSFQCTTVQRSWGRGEEGHKIESHEDAFQTVSSGAAVSIGDNIFHLHFSIINENRFGICGQSSSIHQANYYLGWVGKKHCAFDTLNFN